MQNYSQELWEQDGRARYTDKFISRFEESAKALSRIDRVSNVPIINRLVRSMVTRMEKEYHWGQVLPIEDVEFVLDLQDSIVLLPCPCRKMTTGREARYCIGLGINITNVCGRYPDYFESMELLEPDDAKRILSTFDKEGLLHSIWTFKTPYIGAICNCDQDCMAYRLQVKSGLMQMMFRSEYVGSINWDMCTGCKKCIKNCQFGAILYSITNTKAVIDKSLCYGCGVCRTACDHNAIELVPRTVHADLPW